MVHHLRPHLSLCPRRLTGTSTISAHRFRKDASIRRRSVTGRAWLSHALPDSGRHSFACMDGAGRPIGHSQRPTRHHCELDWFHTDHPSTGGRGQDSAIPHGRRSPVARFRFIAKRRFLESATVADMEIAVYLITALHMATFYSHVVRGGAYSGYHRRMP